MKQIKPIPIGVEFYKKMIDNGYYYIDKTLLIRDILAQKNEVTLFTRPRRFGKTLAQSMLCTFFEKEILPDGTIINDNARYFKGKKIMDAGEEYTRHMGQYPVISLSLKSAKQPDYTMAYAMLRKEITGEFERHRYVLKGQALLPVQKKHYQSIMENKAEALEYAYALQFLSNCLEQYHNKKTIILLDEYDVPLENVYFHGFYDKMIIFIRSLFESALKTNKSLEFSIITGCMRISKESIFTGLNNLDVISILDDSYAEYFGFMQKEVDSMLDAYGISSRKEEVQSWYNGYLFGNTEVYNPWSVIKYVKDLVYKNTIYPKPYWSNTSSNSIVHKLVKMADNDTKQELELLITGGAIEKPVHEDITYEDIDKSQDNLWNFLFFTGYLKAVDRHFKSDTIYLVLKIPNREIRYIYNNTISEWFEQRIKNQDLSELINALEDRNCKKASDIITEQLIDTISFYDYKEDYYHGFLAGLLKQGKKYIIKSNRESGLGRYDLIMKTHKIRQGKTIILELKISDSIYSMEKECKKALEQIENMHYDNDIVKEGYTNIIKYGICFYKKECLIMC